MFQRCAEIGHFFPDMSCLCLGFFRNMEIKFFSVVLKMLKPTCGIITGGQLFTTGAAAATSSPSGTLSQVTKSCPCCAQGGCMVIRHRSLTELCLCFLRWEVEPGTVNQTVTALRSSLFAAPLSQSGSAQPASGRLTGCAGAPYMT